MKFKVFVDGQEGTTGLQIHERLNKRDDIEILTIDPALRKDPEARAKLINASDVTFLCLPDFASKESATLCTNPKTIIIDASTAHRTNPNWAYGLPELSLSHREAIRQSHRIANPGCHASAFILGVYPLISKGILPKNTLLTAYGITGYSGGGKQLISDYETEMAEARSKNQESFIFAPSSYALSLEHKHLPEMQKYAELEEVPHFSPILGPFYKGMAVTVPLFLKQLNQKINPEGLTEILQKHYEGCSFIEVMPYEETPVLQNGRLDCTVCNDTNKARLQVFGNSNLMQITTIIDNLGKGASGAAVQNMNIALGLDEGLSL
ncbi:MAG TPA: N-acetyl-gamma-glutamyl-phosphate reductase [Fibrobacter sp.]|nr:N-acetyl-gamma-glutamyl-phosphate reductase [Fibrobacter sp.]